MVVWLIDRPPSREAACPESRNVAGTGTRAGEGTGTERETGTETETGKGTGAGKRTGAGKGGKEETREEGRIVEERGTEVAEKGVGTGVRVVTNAVPSLVTGVADLGSSHTPAVGQGHPVHTVGSVHPLFPVPADLHQPSVGCASWACGEGEWVGMEQVTPSASARWYGVSLNCFGNCFAPS